MAALRRFRRVLLAATEYRLQRAAGVVVEIRPGRDVMQEEVVQDSPDRYDGCKMADIVPGGSERGLQDAGPDQKSERQRERMPQFQAAGLHGRRRASGCQNIGQMYLERFDYAYRKDDHRQELTHGDYHRIGKLQYTR